jgi:hypothetical protein
MIDNMLSGQHFLAGPSNFSSSDTAMVAALKAAFVVTIGGVEQTILNFDDPSMSPAYVTISGITSSPTEAVTIKYTQPENAAYRCKLGDSDAPSFGPITCTKSAMSE